MKRLFRSEWCRSLLAAITILLLPASAYAVGAKYDVGLGFEFATGQYGTGITTDALYIPFIVEAYPTDRLDFSLELPLVYQSSSAVVGGEFMGMRQSSGSGSTAVMAAMSGPGPRTNASSTEINNSQFGLGDMKLKAGYVLYTEEAYVPAFRPNFFLKIPTADKDKFLGTGAFDGGFGLEVSKWFGKWLTDGEMGYAFQGSSSVVAVKDYLYYSAGAGYQVSERLRPMFFFKGSTATVEGASALLEARLRVKYQFSKQVGLDGYLAKGITTASPDFSTGMALYYYF
jgi:Putative MetA-pathway of phenol degradation